MISDFMTEGNSFPRRSQSLPMSASESADTKLSLEGGHAGSSAAGGQG